MRQHITRTSQINLWDFLTSFDFLTAPNTDLSTNRGKQLLFHVFAVLVAQSCLTLHNSMDCSPLGSSVHAFGGVGQI